MLQSEWPVSVRSHGFNWPAHSYTAGTPLSVSGRTCIYENVVPIELNPLQNGAVGIPLVQVTVEFIHYHWGPKPADKAPLISTARKSSTYLKGLVQAAPVSPVTIRDLGGLYWQRHATFRQRTAGRSPSQTACAWVIDTISPLDLPSKCGIQPVSTSKVHWHQWEALLLCCWLGS